uniref:RING-type domain-containing protein n=1 Tax=Pseudictyota dubia TaxID=2749911 RepID=A0A7R9VWC3_9STRA|mmetsp:Transcript_24626/g.45557  ORF Transcript_24626/g.45557 Transcript_24626/m.45557 type:complete len:336 (+) Transcript_24626:1540-2547(+)
MHDTAMGRDSTTVVKDASKTEPKASKPSRVMTSEYAATPRGAWLMDLLRASPIPGLPDVRRAALRESCRVAPDESALKELFLDAVTGSPHVPDGSKNALAEIILCDRWSELPGAALCEFDPLDQRGTNVGRGDPFEEFRSMALSVFTKSRKVSRLPIDRRRELGTAILSTGTREELMEVMMASLEVAQTLDEESRLKIANDVLEGQFHRLLLPDRFDCDEPPRRGAAARSEGMNPGASVPTVLGAAEEDDCDEEECPICLGARDVANARVLPCGHGFCEECILDWSRAHGCPFPCPVCRAPCQPGPGGIVNDENGGPRTSPSQSIVHELLGIFGT